jgi:hypothetical protein
LIPLRCREFLTKTRQLLQQLRANLDWNAFRTGAESLSAEVNRDASIEAGFEDYLSHTTTSEFWSRLCASADPPQHDGLGHERAIHLHSAVAQYGEDETWGRYLPLLKRHTTETYDLAFWLELHARLFGVKKGTWPELFAFWNRAPSKVEPCVLLSFGRPSPNLTRFIVSPDVKDEAWCEALPQQASFQDGVSGCSPSTSTQVTDNTDISLRQYLDSIR